MGECWSSIPAVQMWTARQERLKQEALQRLVTEHETIVRQLNNSMAVARRDRLRYSEQMQARRRLVPAGQAPSEDVIEDCVMFMSGIVRCTEELRRFRTHLMQVETVLRELNQAGFNRKVHQSWKKIAKEVRKMKINLDEIAVDAEQAEEKLDNVRELNLETKGHMDSVYAAVASPQQEQVAIRSRVHEFLGIAKPAMVVAAAAAAADGDEDNEKDRLLKQAVDSQDEVAIVKAVMA
jgi:predicted  nucleic acid-binding Zn-ribbon protein